MWRALAAVAVLSACTGEVGPSGGAGGGTSGTAGGVAGGSTGGGVAGGSAGGSATAGGAGGASGGASAGGTGGAGGAAGGAAFGCAGHTYKLCEDFESATVGALPTGWSQLAGYGPGNVNVQNDAAHTGTKSLKSTTTSTGQPRAQHSLTGLGATQGTHWGRVFYRVGTPAPNAQSTSNYWHVTMVALRSTDESRVVDTVESPQGKIQYLYNLPDDSCCNGSAYNYSFDGNWHCAEWYVDNPTDSYRFFIDGTEVTSLAFTAKTAARLADFTSVALGSIFYVPSNSMLSVWLDDLAIDDTQIGCQ